MRRRGGRRRQQMVTADLRGGDVDVDGGNGGDSGVDGENGEDGDGNAVIRMAARMASNVTAAKAD
jgi:hypothetical protein